MTGPLEVYTSSVPRKPGTYRCTYCGKDEMPDGEIALEQRDRYGTYAGRWHQGCWERHGYGDFVFDPAAAGERLEEED